MATQILIWWLVIQLLGLAGLPLTAFLFRSLPDQGYAFAKPLGLLLTGYLAWLLAMLGVVPFSGPVLVLCAAIVFAVGALLYRSRARRGEQGPAPKSLFGAWLSSVGRWSVVGYEVLFLLALVFLALLRAHDYNFFASNPNPWFTERPMDFAFFNAIRRSESFPPHDPWMSGYSINYYYFGYMLMAAMALLSGIEPAAAYNLSLALIFALTALGVAGIVINLIRLTTRDQRPTGDLGKSRNVRAMSPWVAALLSVVFVLLAANQGGALQVITGTPSVLALSGRDMIRAVQNGLGPRQPLTLEQPYQEWGQEPTTIITPTNSWTEFNWWNPSRALWDGGRDQNDSTKFYAITEFPLFSFWLGDMHPHVMALPFGLLAMALALQVVARPSAPTFGVNRRGWLELALVGIVLGSLYAINSWDFPTYLLLYLLALLVLYARLGSASNHEIAEERQLPRIWWSHLAQQALFAGVASFVMLAPFYMTFRSLVGSKEPLIDAPLLSSFTRIVGFMTWSRTPLHTFLIIFGLFFLPLASFVFVHGRRLGQPVVVRERSPQRVSQPARNPEALGFALRPAAPLAALDLMPWVVVGLLAAGLIAGFPLLFLLPLSAYAILLALRLSDRPGQAFALLGVALGSLICFGTELFYIRDVFEGAGARMNTIFKFYYQTWLIWGTLAGYALWWLVTRQPTTDTQQPAARGQWSTIGTTALVVITGAFLLGALVYPWLTVGKAFRESPVVGLEGKTPRQRTPGGAAGIQWLRENTRGSDIVLEASGQDSAAAYDGTGQGIGGVSASTGLATVLGWPGHENQWRGGDPAVYAEIEPRRLDVDTIYSTTDYLEAHALLEKYGVDYVYIGEAERSRYTQESLDKFTQIGSVAFQQDEVVIYRVSP